MGTRVIEDEQSRSMLITFIEQHKLPMTVEVTAGKHRTTRQNRLQRQFAIDFAAQLTEHSAEEWRGYFKLHYGVPILRAENEAFAKVYDEVIRPLPYEQKMLIMQVPVDLPVTSKMTTKQKKSYLDQIQKFAAERGIELTDPEALKWTAK